MTDSQQYMFDALRTESPTAAGFLTRKQMRLIHSILGLADEVGELAKELKANLFYNKELDCVNIEEEYGDCCWYLALGTDAAGTDIEKAMTKNINKLRVRYPEKFDSGLALNRDTEKERQVLEE